ncbi:hypothetical protein F5972_24450 [Microbispora cellulosiformans]|uniref:Uncharacterized protein n=1 Tax=Microbispora cellulosiformans TaxID=2614688 RepID=A0A5J5K069_9ACTN|nr:hypothetical protein [Microbispora cellulosiformans]KAA9376549.1 hypothetical protein F5972_24450 [Microbispora cellulosiformans]
MRVPFRIAGLWIRVVLLVILLWGAFLTVLSTFPRESTAAEFEAALRADQVTSVIVINGGPLRLRWSVGPLLWYEVDRGTDAARVRRDLARETETGDQRVSVVWRWAGDQNNSRSPWAFQVPFPGAPWIVGAAWLVTLLTMLGAGQPRWGNRWAWFWLFWVGGVGAILFLLLEPRSLWYGLEPQNPIPRPLRGGQGCVLSICLNLVGAGLAAVGISRAVHALADLLATVP